MRCYLMRNGHITAVAILTVGASDDRLIAEAQTIFKNASRLYDGFEVWDRERFVFRFPADKEVRPPDGVLIVMDQAD